MRITDLKLKLKEKLWSYLRDFLYFQRISDPCLIQNINYNCNPNQKKALICYQTMSHFINFENKSISRTQPFEILKIVNTFSHFGYAIDIIDCIDNKDFEVVKDKNYDLVFGFGDNFHKMTCIQPNAMSVLYMTENHPEFSFQEERKRLDYYYKRHGKKLKIKRSGKYYTISHLQKIYSHVITMGETRFLADQYSNPYFIFPTGLINPDFNYYNKDHIVTRKHFLWMGSSGAVHKGLDLLIDIFAKRDDIVLHICGLQQKERVHLNMPKKKNIIEYGHINIKSVTFLKLVDKCSFIILPSCSEACSTSVTTGMLHGLIPVVMKDAGFTRLGSNAFFLEDFKIDYLDMKLNEFSHSNPDRLALFSRQIYDFAWQNFTITVFENSFRTIISEILNKSELHS